MIGGYHGWSLSRCLDVFDVRPDSRCTRGFFGCAFSAALPTGSLDVPGVADVGVVSRWVCV